MNILNFVKPPMGQNRSSWIGLVSLVMIIMTCLVAGAQAAVHFSLVGDGIPRAGEPRQLAVRMDENDESTPIYAFDISFAVDPTVLKVLSVSEGNGDWGEPAWSFSGGVLRVAYGGATPLVTTMNLFNITVEGAVNAASGASTEIEFASILLNENLTTAVGAGIIVSISGTPIYVNGVTITPETATVREGETLSFDVFVDTNGDPTVDWSFADGFEVGQLIPTGVYAAPSELAVSRQIVVRATSRIFPAAFDEAVLTILPVVGEAQPELWVTTNPANRRLVEVYASVGNNPSAAVEIQINGEVLSVVAVGSPAFAYRASYWADATLGSATIIAEIDNVSLSRTINF